MNNRIVLFGHMRSGSTQYLNAFNHYHQTNDPNYFICKAEVYTNPHPAYDKFIDTYRLNREKLKNRDSVELTKAFLHAFRNDKFMIKYFPLLMQEFSPHITPKEIIKACKKYKAEIHFLYRKNILDTIISYAVMSETNISHDDKKDPVKINFNKIIFNNSSCIKYIERICKQIKLCIEYYKIFDNAKMISKIMTYEDNIVTGDYMYESKIIKQRRTNSDESKNIILSNHPNFKNLVVQYCDKYNLIIDSEYNLNFYKTLNNL